MKAHVEFDTNYIPQGFAIVAEGFDCRNDDHSIVVDTDWDYPSVAQSMGWSLSDYQPELPNYVGPDCQHDSTDGTVTCSECGATAGEFISAAFDYILAHECEEFDGLGEYLAVQS